MQALKDIFLRQILIDYTRDSPNRPYSPLGIGEDRTVTMMMSRGPENGNGTKS